MSAPVWSLNSQWLVYALVLKCHILWMQSWKINHIWSKIWSVNSLQSFTNLWKVVDCWHKCPRLDLQPWILLNKPLPQVWQMQKNPTKSNSDQTSMKPQQTSSPGLARSSAAKLARGKGTSTITYSNNLGNYIWWCSIQHTAKTNVRLPQKQSTLEALLMAELQHQHLTLLRNQCLMLLQHRDLDSTPSQLGVLLTNACFGMMMRHVGFPILLVHLDILQTTMRGLVRCWWGSCRLLAMLAGRCSVVWPILRRLWVNCANSASLLGKGRRNVKTAQPRLQWLSTVLPKLIQCWCLHLNL